jgi:ATP-dependent protease HslVU (ClpYQ) peptidase subunit
MEADSDRQDQNVRKILKAVTISGSASTTLDIIRRSALKKFNYEIKKGHQNLVRLSLETFKC